MELIHAQDLKQGVDMFSTDAVSSIAAAGCMLSKTIENTALQMFTVLCANAAQERHVLRLSDEEYLRLMRDPDSKLFQGDESKQHIEDAFGLAPVPEAEKGNKSAEEEQTDQSSSESDAD